MNKPTKLQVFLFRITAVLFGIKTPWGFRVGIRAYSFLMQQDQELVVIKQKLEYAMKQNEDQSLSLADYHSKLTSTRQDAIAMHRALKDIATQRAANLSVLSKETQELLKSLIPK